MARTIYRRPTSIDEAIAALAEYGFDAKILAGGQSLIPMISLGLARPSVLVDIGRIPSLDGLDLDEGLAIGALVKHRAFEAVDPAIEAAVPLMTAAAPWIGHAAIRNRGTVVGSIAHGDPAAEWPAVAVGLDATVHILGARGPRSVPAADFFVGPLTTDVAEDELVVGVTFPVARPRTGAVVLELAYRHGDYAVVGVAAQVTAGQNERLEDVRIVLFGVDATPIRARAAETVAIEGPRAFPEAGRTAAGEANPSTDATASAAYRRAMIEVHVRRALGDAFARADAIAVDAAVRT
jgi:carbon-monoxide dehydrogenase medium subunit